MTVISDGSVSCKSESDAARQLPIKNADDPAYRAENRIGRNGGKQLIEVDAEFVSSSGLDREWDGQWDTGKKDEMKIERV